MVVANTKRKQKIASEKRKGKPDLTSSETKERAKAVITKLKAKDSKEAKDLIAKLEAALQANDEDFDSQKLNDDIDAMDVDDDNNEGEEADEGGEAGETGDVGEGGDVGEAGEGEEGKGKMMVVRKGKTAGERARSKIETRTKTKARMRTKRAMATVTRSQSSRKSPKTTIPCSCQMDPTKGKTKKKTPSTVFPCIEGTTLNLETFKLLGGLGADSPYSSISGEPGVVVVEPQPPLVGGAGFSLSLFSQHRQVRLLD